MILVNLFYNKRKEILKKYRSEIGFHFLLRGITTNY